MRSIVLTATAKLFFVLMLLASLWLLLRGHNEPGGGFVGGLVGAAAFATLALAMGVDTAKRRLIVHPVVLMSIGLLIALLSGVPGILLDDSFLTHQWATLPLGITELKLGTTIAFDIGVYLVVVGGVLAFMFRLYVEEPE